MEREILEEREVGKRPWREGGRERYGNDMRGRGDKIKVH